MVCNIMLYNIIQRRNLHVSILKRLIEICMILEICLLINIPTMRVSKC